MIGYGDRIHKNYRGSPGLILVGLSVFKFRKHTLTKLAFYPKCPGLVRHVQVFTGL